MLKKRHRAQMSDKSAANSFGFDIGNATENKS